MTRRAARALGVAACLGFLAWGAAALHFAGPGGALARDAAAAAWTAAGLVVLLALRPLPRAFGGFALLAAVLLAWWAALAPRNDRRWSADVARLPEGVVEGDRLTLRNVRNFAYRSESDWTERWETRSYDLARLEGVDLFLSYWGPRHIAHTIVSWRFEDGAHLAISIELRKEVGETYSPVAGFFKRYELYYVVADERDVIGLRANHRGESVHLYPLTASRAGARRLLLDYVASMNELTHSPRFYDTLTHNCTTTIRTHVLAVGAAAPWDWRIYANGHADEMLYERAAIDTSRPFAAVRAASRIDARARAANGDPAFSARIREGVAVPPPRPDPPAPPASAR